MTLGAPWRFFCFLELCSKSLPTASTSGTTDDPRSPPAVFLFFDGRLQILADRFQGRPEGRGDRQVGTALSTPRRFFDFLNLV